MSAIYAATQQTISCILPAEKQTYRSRRTVVTGTQVLKWEWACADRRSPMLYTMAGGRQPQCHMEAQAAAQA